MRVVYAENDLFESVKMTENEAEQAFKNSTVYLEKYLPNPRHIEIQVLSDSHGNCIHLGERDCSIQRRHQKIIEETPAPKLSNGDRVEIGNICTSACKKLGLPE